MRKVFVFGAVAIVLGLVAACGGSDKTPTPVGGAAMAGMRGQMGTMAGQMRDMGGQMDGVTGQMSNPQMAQMAGQMAQMGSQMGEIAGRMGDMGGRMGMGMMSGDAANEMRGMSQGMEAMVTQMQQMRQSMAAQGAPQALLDQMEVLQKRLDDLALQVANLTKQVSELKP